jgi:hypothetical protein
MRCVLESTDCEIFIAALCLGLLAQADEIQFTTLPQPVQTTVVGQYSPRARCLLRRGVAATVKMMK